MKSAFVTMRGMKLESLTIISSERKWEEVLAEEMEFLEV